MAIILALLLVIVHTIFCYSNPAHLKNVEKCMGKYATFNSNELEIDVDEPFFINFDEVSVEIVDILNSDDMKRVTKLASCIQSISPSSFHFEIPHDNDNKNLGYGNVTHLNGYFHSLLGPIYNKIVQSTDRTIDKVKWTNSSKLIDLGIRCVRLVSYNHKVPVKPQKEIRRLLEKKRLENAKFVIYHVKPNDEIVPEPDPVEVFKKEVEESMLNPDYESDHAVSSFIQSSDDSKFTLFILLSDREEYERGNLLVRKLNQLDYGNPIASSGKSNKISGIVSDKEDEKDEIERDMALSDRKNEKLFKNKYKFNALTNDIARHTPDRGNGVLLHSSQDHGIQPIKSGSIMYLVLELWPYDHAGVGTTHKISIKEAKPLQKRAKNNTEL